MAEQDRTTVWLERRWLWGVAAIWLAAVGYMLVYKWGAIHWLALGDTDDNIRFAQVRALLDGQGWYDLRQYKLDPPHGANIHWSRFCDLPIAGLMLALRPLIGVMDADRIAVTVAPLLPMFVAMLGIALTVRRLVAPSAWLLGLPILLLGGQSALFMWMPLRIDHHGWQLAFLILTVAGFADARRVRGGILIALSSAMSLAIGLEMLPYIGMAAAAMVLRWVWDRDEAPGLIAYAVALGAGTAAAFAVFASNDNRAAVCDALSPVWLSVALLGAALVAGLAQVRAGRWQIRFACAVAAGAILALFYVLVWPKCTGQLEGMSPELKRLWFNNVREAKPVYEHRWRLALPILALPLIGLVGAAIATWRARATAIFSAWACVLLFAAFSFGLVMWQTRAGPSAQLLAVPGATAIGWMIIPRLLGHRMMLVRIFGSSAAFVLISGLAAYWLTQAFPEPPKPPARQRAENRSRFCGGLPALRPIARMPAATMLTFVDFGPRLIAMTHHRAVAGPYHRNGQAIIDIHHAFRGTPEIAHDVVRRHEVTMVLLCPGMPESTIYAAQAKRGFYMQLIRGKIPAWLTPVALPKDSPFRMWRVVG